MEMPAHDPGPGTLNIGLRWLITLALAALVLGLLVPQFSVCHDHMEIDWHSGSRRGYRTWIFGLKTNQWTRESALAKALNQHFPGCYEPNWHFLGKTGRGILGNSTYIACGHVPSHFLVYLMHDEMITPMIKSASPDELKALYELLVQEEFEAFDAQCQGMFDLALQ
jgi:hypothetical protein